MSTKVKGEAIKEGSIPLSAFNDEVRDMIENAGGKADWNAKEGEVGYIKNKPFESGDIRQIYVNGDYSINVGKFNVGDRIDISWDLTYYNEKIVRGNTSFVIEEGVNTYYNKDNFNIYVGDYNDGVHIYAEAFGGGESHYGKVIVAVNNKPIPESYIPNTVIKTTPQTLSDTDKNQALANLGIDFNVLMYSMNPIVIEFHDRIPEELWDTNSNRLKGEVVLSGQNYRIYAPIKIHDSGSSMTYDLYYNNTGYYYNDYGMYTQIYIVNGILKYTPDGGSM